MPNISIKVTFHNGETMTISDKDFFNAVKFILDFTKEKSIYAVFLEFSSGKILYFDDKKFQSFIDGDLEQIDLIAHTECDGVYRNNVDVVLSEHDEIEIGCLWKLMKNNFVLIDDDRFLIVKYPDSNFVPV